MCQPKKSDLILDSRAAFQIVLSIKYVKWLNIVSKLGKQFHIFKRHTNFFLQFKLKSTWALSTDIQYQFSYVHSKVFAIATENRSTIFKCTSRKGIGSQPTSQTVDSQTIKSGLLPTFASSFPSHTPLVSKMEMSKRFLIYKFYSFYLHSSVKTCPSIVDIIHRTKAIERVRSQSKWRQWQRKKVHKAISVW